MKATLRDVAERSGFSITTVSHVLNDVPGKRIAPDTRETIRRVADELAYRPNQLAQGLRRQRSGTIGFLADSILTTPHAHKVISGAQDAAAEAGSMLLLVSTDGRPELEERGITAFLDRQVDGIVYAATYHRIVTPPPSLRARPAVLLDARTDAAEYPSAVPDEVGSARTAVAELVRAGHRRIGYLGNVDDIPATAGRLAGYRQALAEAGLPWQPAWEVAEASESTGGYRAARAVLDRPDRPTALFCFNDRMALGAYFAVQDLGLAVALDVSIIGFDDQEIISEGVHPGLTTMRLPHYEMGQWGIRTLLSLIDAPSDGPYDPVHFDCPLVRRASVGSPRG
ncbi:LacI family DNA-binding transcriptional regulator [Nakamurella endophytica]|nr:LacI family DNA-binding transcriptional regulator [Nakamurella endophytica]